MIEHSKLMEELLKEFGDLLNQNNSNQSTLKHDNPIPVEIRPSRGDSQLRKTQSLIPQINHIEVIRIGKDDHWKFTASSLEIQQHNKQESQRIGLISKISNEDKPTEILVSIFNGKKVKLQFDSTSKVKQFRADYEKHTDPQKGFFTKFFKRRVSREILENKGIIKDELVFGRKLDDIFLDIQDVPKFIYEIMKIIEEEPNLKCQGLYRTSGNLASIQKIRLHVDQNKLEILNNYRKDIDVLTGTLKLFFRELKTPLLSDQVVAQIVAIIDKNDCQDQVRPILKNLSVAHQHALYVLLKHLIKVLKFHEENKMDCYNLSVCWAQAVIFINDIQSQDMVTKFAEAVRVFEFILSYYNQHQEALKFLEVETLPKQQPAIQNSMDTYSVNVIASIIGKLEKNLSDDGIYMKAGNAAKVEKIMKALKKSKNLQFSKSDSCVDLAHVLRKYLKELNVIGSDVVNYYNTRKSLVTKQEILDKIPKRHILDLVLAHMENVLNNSPDLDKEKFIDLMSKNLTDKPETDAVPLVKFLLNKSQPDLLRDLERNESYRTKQNERDRTKSVYDNVDT